MNEAQLKRIVDNGLSDNFGGDDMSNIFLDSYSGDGDLSVDFGESSSFVDENKAGRKYTVKIVNTTGVDKTIVLFPAYFDVAQVSGSDVVYTDPTAIKAANFTADAVLCDGEIFSDGLTPEGTIVVSSPDFAVRDFINYAKSNPMRAASFIIEANDKSVFPDYIREFNVNPFNQSAERKIPVTDYLKVENNQDKKINVPESLLFSSSSLIVFKMPGLVNAEAYTELKFTFNIGAIINSGVTLDKKAKLARKNILRAASLQMK